MPDENAIRDLHEALTKAVASYALLSRFDRYFRSTGYLAMGDQISDATIVSAPKQGTISEGKIPKDWKDKPTKLAQ